MASEKIRKRTQRITVQTITEGVCPEIDPISQREVGFCVWRYAEDLEYGQISGIGKLYVINPIFSF